MRDGGVFTAGALFRGDYVFVCDIVVYLRDDHVFVCDIVVYLYIPW